MTKRQKRDLEQRKGSVTNNQLPETINGHILLERIHKFSDSETLEKWNDGSPLHSIIPVLMLKQLLVFNLNFE